MENHSDFPENHKNHVKGFLGGMMVGGLTGAVTMLLVAPQSGKRTRAKIQQRSIELRDQATDTLDDVVAQTRDKARQIRRSVNDQAEAIRQRAQGMVDEQKERLSSVVDAGGMAVQGILNSRTPGK
jgi:gas vesicle protein